MYLTKYANHLVEKDNVCHAVELYKKVLRSLPAFKSAPGPCEVSQTCRTQANVKILSRLLAFDELNKVGVAFHVDDKRTQYFGTDV